MLTFANLCRWIDKMRSSRKQEKSVVDGGDGKGLSDARKREIAKVEKLFQIR
jgi:hypothetical protein